MKDFKKSSLISKNLNKISSIQLIDAFSISNEYSSFKFWLESLKPNHVYRYVPSILLPQKQLQICILNFEISFTELILENLKFILSSHFQSILYVYLIPSVRTFNRCFIEIYLNRC